MRFSEKIEAFTSEKHYVKKFYLVYKIKRYEIWFGRLYITSYKTRKECISMLHNMTAARKNFLIESERAIINPDFKGFQYTGLNG